MNKKTSTIIGALAVLIFLVGIIYISTHSVSSTVTPAGMTGTSAGSESLAPGSSVGSVGTSTPPGTSSSSYTLAEVATHNSETSCWTTIKGNVYDVTDFIHRHPGGGNAILSLCGKDGTAAFTNQHDAQPRPNNELSGFIIGTLKK